MHIAFDIGGTDIKYAVIEKETFTHRGTIPTEAYNGGLSILKRMVVIIKDLQKSFNLKGICISSAGVIDSNQGLVLAATNAIPNYVGIHVAKFIESELNLPTSIENDVNCMALAEAFYGHHPHDTFIAMTIGTGIGGAIIIDKKLHHGSKMSAGEWGQMIINGKKYEDLASVSSLVTYAKQAGLDVSNGLDVFTLYDQGNDTAKQIVTTFYKHLANGIANLVYAINPPMVVLGGGISNRGQKFIDELKTHLKDFLEPYYLDSFDLRLARHLNDAGMIGAYAHWVNQFEKKTKDK